MSRRQFKGPEDIVGHRFGRLTVVAYLRREPYKKRYDYYYRCLCSCGGEVEAKRSNLITSHTGSCGCLRKRRGPASPSWGGHGEISGRIWSAIRKHAEARKLAFDLTIEEAWELFEEQGGLCALTGLPLSQRPSSGGAPTAESASLDRIDNTRGYSPDNVQWVLKDINWMKGTFTQDRFLELCRAVAQHVRKE